MQPDPEAREMVVVSLHRGVRRGWIAVDRAWPLRFGERAGKTRAPAVEELTTSREGTRRANAHANVAP